jgi:hypothetical protein
VSKTPAAEPVNGYDLRNDAFVLILR